MPINKLNKEKAVWRQLWPANNSQMRQGLAATGTIHKAIDATHEAIGTTRKTTNNALQGAAPSVSNSVVSTPHSVDDENEKMSPCARRQQSRNCLGLSAAPSGARPTKPIKRTQPIKRAITYCAATLARGLPYLQVAAPIVGAMGLLVAGIVLPLCGAPLWGAALVTSAGVLFLCLALLPAGRLRFAKSSKSPENTPPQTANRQHSPRRQYAALQAEYTHLERDFTLATKEHEAEKLVWHNCAQEGVQAISQGQKNLTLVTDALADARTTITTLQNAVQFEQQQNDAVTDQSKELTATIQQLEKQLTFKDLENSKKKNLIQSYEEKEGEFQKEIAQCYILLGDTILAETKARKQADQAKMELAEANVTIKNLTEELNRVTNDFSLASTHLKAREQQLVDIERERLDAEAAGLAAEAHANEMDWEPTQAVDTALPTLAAGERPSRSSKYDKLGRPLSPERRQALQTSL